MRSNLLGLAGLLLVPAGLTLAPRSAEAQTPDRRVSASAAGFVVPILNEDFRAFAETGFGVGANVSLALSARWRLTAAFQGSWFDGKTASGDWTTVEANGRLGFAPLVGESSELVLEFGAGLISFNPEVKLANQVSAVDSFTRPAVTAGARFSHFFSPAAGLTLEARGALSIPGDDIAGPDDALTLPLGAGLVVRF